MITQTFIRDALQLYSIILTAVHPLGYYRRSFHSNIEAAIQIALQQVPDKL